MRLETKADRPLELNSCEFCFGTFLSVLRNRLGQIYETDRKLDYLNIRSLIDFVILSSIPSKRNNTISKTFKHDIALDNFK